MKAFFSIIVCILFTYGTSAQDKFTVVQDSSTITVFGTSSAHDWETSTTETEGVAILNFENGNLLSVDSVSITFPANSFKSGKKVMDKKTRGALNDKKHPTIHFELISIDNISEDSLYTTGTFTVAGVTVETEVSVKYSVSPSGDIKFEGSAPFKMTDFGISPPTALLGSLKTGNEIDVSFNVLFNVANNL